MDIYASVFAAADKPVLTVSAREGSNGLHPYEVIECRVRDHRGSDLRIVVTDLSPEARRRAEEVLYLWGK